MKPRSALALFVSATAICAACATVSRGMEAVRRWSDVFLHGRGEMSGDDQEGLWTYTWENGKKRAEGNYEGDRQTGRWTYWYESGQKEWEGGFEDEHVHGPATYWYENGQVRARGSFARGLEEGLWTFWRPDGSLDQQGDFTRGLPQLRWTHWGSDGEVSADGFRLNGSKVGVWSYWDEAGTAYAMAHGMPDGYALAVDAWEDGAPRREGFLHRGQKSGRWVARNRDGGRRIVGDFAAGRPTGEWSAFYPDGTPLAVGAMSERGPSGTWRLWAAGRVFERAGSEFPPLAESGGNSAADAFAYEVAPEVAVVTWIAELVAPVEAKPQATDGLPEPPHDLLEKSRQKPRIPFRAQPWTVSEVENIEYMVELYDVGAAAAKVRPRGGRYGGRKARPAVSEGDVERAAPLLEKPLAVTELRTGDGRSLDLNDFRGERNVLLVILRGFAGEVCIYCAAQVRALENHVDEFRRLGVEVVVVYPGARDRLDAFLESYGTLKERGGDPPFTIAYDPDFSLVKALDITGKLALPTTLILDKEGKVHYAYVGKDKVDRPAATSLLETLRALEQP